ncbi:MAG: TonB family protein [Marinagarivorans sp.]
MWCRKSILFLLLGMNSFFVCGEPTSEKGVALGTIRHITANLSVILSSETSYYSPELLNMGVNGVVLLTGKILKTGEVINLEVKESSGTKELDEAAKKYILANTVKKERDYELLVDFPVEFSRSFSLDALHVPSCSGVLKDVAYFKKNFPDKKLSDTRYMQAVIGTMMVSNVHGAKLKERISHEAAIKSALAACQQNENQSFFFLVYKALFEN